MNAINKRSKLEICHELKVWTRQSEFRQICWQIMTDASKIEDFRRKAMLLRTASFPIVTKFNPSLSLAYDYEKTILEVVRESDVSLSTSGVVHQTIDTLELTTRSEIPGSGPTGSGPIASEDSQFSISSQTPSDPNPPNGIQIACAAALTAASDAIDRTCATYGACTGDEAIRAVCDQILRSKVTPGMQLPSPLTLTLTLIGHTGYAAP